MILIFKRHHILKKLLLVGLVAVFCFVASGLGVLALPKKAKAIGPVFDIKQILNNILVAIWKSVLFPLIKEIIIGWITTGEFPMTMDEFKTWLYEDLLFQTLESVFNEFANFSLCARFSANIRIALGQNELSDEKPECTYDESELAQMVEDMVRAGDSEEAWSEIGEDFLGNFAITAQGSNNQYGAWYETQDRFYAQSRRTEDDLRLEVGANRGFLGQRDCSRWTEANDQNGDGERQDNECPLQTTGESAASALESYNTLEEGTIGSEVFSDLIALFGQVIDLVINKAISGGISAISNWKSSKDRSSVQEYQQAQEAQRVGDNRVIEH